MAIDVYACPHPFRAARTHHTVEPGLTLAEILESAQPDPVLRRHALIMVGDRAVPADLWPQVRPKEGAAVAIRVIPHGGDDKSPLRTILTIAVTVVSGGIASGAISLGLSSTGALVAGAATTMVGRLLVDSIAPPPVPDLGGGIEADAQRPSIQNARNQARPYQPVWRTFGTDRIVPPLAAKPFTEVQGRDQYLRLAVVWGYGPLEIANVKIGDTPIEDFDDVEVSHNFGDGNGWTNGNRFSKDVDEQALQAALTNSGGWVSRTTDEDVDEISVDVTWPQGLVEFSDDAKKLPRTVKIEVQYAPAGTSNWSASKSGEAVSATQVTLSSTQQFPRVRRKDLIYVDRLSAEVKVEQGNLTALGANLRAPSTPRGGAAVAEVEVQNQSINAIANLARPDVVFGSSSDFQVSVNSGLTLDVTSGTIIGPSILATARRTSTVRKSLSFKVPTGQYDVRLKRVTADSSSDQVRDSSVWTAMRSIKHSDPVSMTGIAQTHVVIRATDQLNGVIDRLNGEVTSILEDYDQSSSTWIERPTNNPAAAVREILQGAANAGAVADARIDLAQLEALSTHCEDNGFTFDYTFDRGSTVQRALQKALSVARASPTLIDGKWSVVIDQAGKSVVQTFTERSSRGFRGSKRFGYQPHALRVKFRNANKGYQDDEVTVYDDGYTSANATQFEGMPTEGITDEDQAWKMGRYQMAVNRLRPETYELDVDIAHLVATRGDLVRVRHDVPLWGSGAGRVKSVQTSGGNITGVTVDETLALTAGTDYVMRFWFNDGSGELLRDIETVATDTETSTVTFVTPIATASGPAAGDQFIFGIKDQESVKLLIKGISRSDPDGNVTLTLVDEAPAVHDADENIPSFDPRITEPEPFDGNRPPQPVVDEIQSDEDVLVVGANSAVQPQIVLTYSVASSSEVQATSVEVRYREAGEDTGYRYRRAPAAEAQIALDQVETDANYEIDIRSLNDERGIASRWRSVETAYRVIGTSSTPADIDNLTVQAVSSLAVLRWDRHEDLDVRVGGRIEFRHSKRTSGATWENSVSIGDSVNGNATEAVLPLKSGTYLARAVDDGGRRGSAASVSTNGARAVAFTTIDTVQEHPTFPGTNSNTIIDEARSPGALKLTGQGLFSNIPLLSDVSSIAAYGGVELSGTYTFDTGFDLGSVTAVQIETLLDVVIASINDKISDRTENISQWESFSGSEGAEGNAEIWVRTTDDDPNASPTWSDWQRIEVGEYEARGFQFQSRLSVTNPTYQIFVEELQAEVKEAA